MIKGVTIAGTSWDLDQVLADVTIRHGRGAWGEAPAASSAQVTLWDAPRDLPPLIGVGNPLRLTTAGDLPRFTGTITDAAVTFPDPQLGAQVTLTAIGHLADLGRITVGGTDYPAEAASARLARIAQEAQLATWAFECPPAHDYQLAARPAKPTTALALLTDLATSLGATLFDTPAGGITLQAIHYRAQATAHDIPAHRIAYAPTWRQAWEVENSVSVKWDGGEELVEDSTSIARWGKREGKIETSLASAQVARQRGLDRITRQATPRWQLGDLLTDLTPAQLQLAPGDLALVALDQQAGLPLPRHPMGVEGWTDRQLRSTWTTTLHLSDGLMSYAGLTWDDIPPSDPAFTWASIDQDTPWSAALTLHDLKA